MSVGLPGVSEEGVRDPDFAHHVAVQHEHFHGAVELEAAVIPRLGKEDVDGVFLQTTQEDKHQYERKLCLHPAKCSPGATCNTQVLLTMLMGSTGPMLLTYTPASMTVGRTETHTNTHTQHKQS